MSDSTRPRSGGPQAPRHAELQQQRPAALAWQWVSDAEHHANAARYGILAAKLPSMLQVSGLGQTLAFLYAKGHDKGKKQSDKAEALLIAQLGGYLVELSKRPRVDAMEALLSLTPSEYRMVTRKIWEVAEWLKRFAEGRLTSERGE